MEIDVVQPAPQDRDRYADDAGAQDEADPAPARTRNDRDRSVPNLGEQSQSSFDLYVSTTWIWT
jgi:hypothetical protein